MKEIPGRAKAFRAEAQSRREDKANRAAIYFEPLRLCASARVRLFFHTFCGRGVRSCELIEKYRFFGL
jgi:hypothetical protein